MMKTLTVFTPTYNRAYLLPQLYESLCRQTSKNFCWLVVDDGSTDDTRQLIQKWKDEAPFPIQYVYQENQGMHGGHNTAYKHCETEFNICIDSDDYMPDNAVERILFHLNNLPQHFAGLIGLDADKTTGKVIGTTIPETLKNVKINELYTLYGVKGDKKLVYRTEVVRKYPPYPLYRGERFVPLDYLYLLIDQDYDLKPVNEVFCIVEYQQDGSTKNILKQYRRHPNGFAFSRVSRIKYGATFKERFKNAVHLVSSAIFAKDYRWLGKTDKPLLMFFSVPFGLILNFYIRYKTK
ncbi:MAG: glycosyltransferase family 2 protein [Bergeyella sp.]